MSEGVKIETVSEYASTGANWRPFFLTAMDRTDCSGQIGLECQDLSKINSVGFISVTAWSTA